MLEHVPIGSRVAPLHVSSEFDVVIGRGHVDVDDALQVVLVAPHVGDARGLCGSGSVGRGGRVRDLRRVEAPAGGDYIAPIEGDSRLEHVKDAHHALSSAPLARDGADAGGQIRGAGKATPRRPQGPGRDEGGLTGQQDELVGIEDDGDNGAGGRGGDDAAATRRASALSREQVPEESALRPTAATRRPSRPFWTRSSSSRGIVRSSPDR